MLSYVTTCPATFGYFVGLSKIQFLFFCSSDKFYSIIFLIVSPPLLLFLFDFPGISIILVTKLLKRYSKFLDFFLLSISIFF